MELQDGRPAYVYILLEHKSYPDPETPFQVLRYEMRIWENDWRNGDELRPIIPLVLYHGRERWRAATDFGGLFTGDEVLRPYWPQARYELLDLSGYSDEEVRGAAHLQIGLLVMRYILDPALRDHLADIFTLFHDLSESRTALEYLRTVLYYMSQAAAHLQPKEMVKVVKGMLADEGSEIMQTVADYWIEQGIEQGVEQGIEQGLAQGLQETVLDILSVRFDTIPPEIEEAINDIDDVDQLRYLRRQTVLVEDLDEFIALLPNI